MPKKATKKTAKKAAVKKSVKKTVKKTVKQAAKKPAKKVVRKVKAVETQTAPEVVVQPVVDSSGTVVMQPVNPDAS